MVGRLALNRSSPRYARLRCSSLKKRVWHSPIRRPVSLSKLRDECLKLKIFYKLKEAQIVIGAWEDHSDRIRPHSALGYRPPAPSPTPLEGAPGLIWRKRSRVAANAASAAAIDSHGLISLR